jgi:hypothetical protein
MKKTTLLIVALLALGLAGCSKDAEINAFMKDVETVTNEMSQKIEAGDIDGAQKTFDAKKADLKAKWEGVKTARGFQVSAETQKNMESGMMKNMNALTAASTKNAMALAMDKGKMDKLQALIKEYAGIFQM